MKKEKATYKLPKGWIEVEISDISLTINYGYTAKSVSIDTGIKFLRITDIQDNHVNWNSVPYCIIDEFDKPKYILNKGDIVFARTGATVGKSFLIGENIPETVFASYLIRIQLSNQINPKYVYQYFQSGSYWKQIGVKALGVGQPHINANSLSKIKLPLPQLNEQNQIVSKIEEFFSELEKGKEQLEKIQHQFKVYRQSLLKEVFESKQVEQLSGLSTKKWKLVRLSDVLDFVGSGTTPKGGKEVYQDSGVIFIRSQNVYPNKLLLDEVAYISNSIDEKMKRTRVQPFDVLLNITGASIGRCAYIPEGFSKANVNQHVCILRTKQNVLNHVFLSYYLNSPGAQTEIMNTQTGATRQGLNFQQIRNFYIPLPTLNEQHQIVQLLERKLTVLDKTEEDVKFELNKANALKHSILQKAFSGKLVPQDQNDESTSKLLERIKKEREEYLAKQKNIRMKLKDLIIKKDMAEELKTILQILQESNKSVAAKKLWQSSEHKDNIDGFYSKLKELIEKGEVVETERKGKESYLKLANVK